MPIVHEVRPGERIARVTARNPLTLEEVRDSIRGLWKDPGFQPEFRVLVDLRGTGYTPGLEEIQQIAETLGEMKDRYRGRVAVLVSDDLRYGILRMTSTYAELKGFSMPVFRDLAGAEAWLNQA